MSETKTRPDVGLTEEDIEHLFTYHPPVGDQIERYQAIRESAKNLAKTIAQACPRSADRTRAINSLRDAVMQANASIAPEQPE